MLLKVIAAVLALALAATAGAVVVTALDDDPDLVIRDDAFAPSGTPAGDDSDDEPLTAREAERAEAAALRETGGGEVVELDRSDDPGEAFEVEVVKDGRETDVALDANFEPVPNRRPDG